MYICIAKTSLFTYHELVTFMERDIYVEYHLYRHIIMKTYYVQMTKL